MKFAVVVFPGSNCDRDCHHVVSRVLGHEAEYVWHQERDVSSFDVVILPGGFSYGDYLRAGAVAKISPVMGAVARFAAVGGPVIGICNGFQILLECGLLPGAMLRNRSLHFMCKDVDLACVTDRTPFTRSLGVGAQIRLPIANAEGNYTIDDVGLAALREHDQIVLQYCDAQGHATAASNPNGATANIASICNVAGNVVGMMPHPERASEALLGNTAGRILFESVIEAVGR